MRFHFVRAHAVLLAVLLLTAVLFVQLLGAPPLTWDDDSNIFGNPYYHAGWWAVFWEAPYFGLYVPVTSFIWQVVFNLGANAAWPFRCLNLGLHAANILLVYSILREAGGRWRIDGRWPVFFSLALFAFHPLQVETVAWISGGRDLLAAFFSLVSARIYLLDDRRKTFAAATVFFALAILSKPNSVVLPMALPVLDLLLRPSQALRLAPRLSLWAALCVWPVYMTVGAQAGHLVEVDRMFRPWVMLDAYAFYLGKLIWPWPLSGNYARTPESVLALPQTLLGGLAFAFGLGVLSVYAWFRDRRLLAIWLWAVLLLPVSGIVVFGFQKISTVADHYMYLPMTGVSLFALACAGAFERWRRPAFIIALVGIIGFYVVAWSRAQVFRSDEAFFKDMAQTSPHSYSTAIGMSIVMCQNLKDYDAGVHWTEVALAARPLDIVALANQAYCFLHAGNHLRVTELEYYLDQMNLEELAQSQPTAYSSLLASIGTSEIEMKQYEDGFQYLCEAYRVKPAEPNHLRNLQTAAEILRAQGFTPTCDPDEGDETDEDPFEEIFPGGPAGEDEPDAEPESI